jgi:MSHA biogenesis protein MshP
MVAAVFVVVVVASLSVVMSSMLQIDAATYSRELLSSRAFLAAESGAQFGINRIVPPAGGGSCADRLFTFPDTPLAMFTATVTCSDIVVDGTSFYTVASTGFCDAGDRNATRVIEVRLRQ